MINIIKASLFDAPKGSILVHACNAQGVWGSGIAKEFKKRFPESFQFYHELCNDFKSDLLGTTIICPEENGYVVACLMTSNNYGDFKDPPSEILINTRLALPSLLQEKNRQIFSCKINAGLFNVPWESTQIIIEDIIAESGYTDPWTVCEL